MAKQDKPDDFNPWEPPQIPEPWFTELTKSGFVNEQTGEPSMRALAKHINTHPSSLSRLFRGETKYPKKETLEKLAIALDKPFSVISNWVGHGFDEPETWTPPKDSVFLTHRQRRAIEELINAFVEANRTGGNSG